MKKNKNQQTNNKILNVQYKKKNTKNNNKIRIKYYSFQQAKILTAKPHLEQRIKPNKNKNIQFKMNNSNNSNIKNKI